MGAKKLLPNASYFAFTATPKNKAVQTLSRLNRAHPQKHDVFVLDLAATTVRMAVEAARLARGQTG
jgi:type I site-specific restriction-modification system R (restriction) subunit